MSIFGVGRRKGSMSLSIESIVILIIAITMLGLSLGFVKNMFSKVAKGFDEQVKNEPEAPAADSSKPITISREMISAKPGDKLALKVNVYNPLPTDLEGVAPLVGVQPEFTCHNGEGATAVTFTSTGATSTRKIILSGQSASFIFLFSLQNTAAKNDYLCTMTVAPLDSATNPAQDMSPYATDFRMTIE